MKVDDQKLSHASFGLGLFGTRTGKLTKVSLVRLFSSVKNLFEVFMRVFIIKFIVLAVIVVIHFHMSFYGRSVVLVWE